MNNTETGLEHDQVEIVLGPQDKVVNVDAYISRVIDLLNNRVGIPTYESCENYGEYLRGLGMDFNFESKRDYAYIEFYSLAAAEVFLEYVKDQAGVANPIHHKIANEGTPDAWDLKWRASTGQPWVWFPSSDIEELEKLLDA